MKKGKGLKKSFSSRKFKMGGFQTLVMVIVIAVVIVLNLVVKKMDITVDLSRNGMYSLSDDSKKVADSLKEDVVIYYLCQDGGESISAGAGYKTINMENIVRQYEELPHITVEKKDPVLYPNFAKDYTEDEISNNDVLVVNSKSNKSVHVAFSDMINTEMDYTTYQEVPTEIDLEGKITSAIQQVTSENSRKVYITSGHGEQELSNSFSDVFDKSNIATETLETLSAKKIPDDCDILLVNGPQYDFSEKEYKIISSYLANGGKAMFFNNLTAGLKNMKQYYRLLGDYGVNVADGVVIDTEQCMSADLPLVLKPTIESHDVTGGTEKLPVYIDTVTGMTSQKDVRSTLKIEPLLTTSESAFSRTDTKDGDYSKKNDSDISGPFNVAVAVSDDYAEKTQGEGHATRLLVFGSPNFTLDSLIKSNQFGNRTMLLNGITWLTGGEKVSTLAIPARNMQEQSVIIKDGDIVFWTVALVVIIPLILLIVGFVIWYRRRKN